MEKKDPFADPQSKSSSPTSQSDSSTPQSARSAHMDDPFLDPPNQTTKLTRSDMPLPQQLPIETVFQSFNSSQGGAGGTPLNPFPRLPRDTTFDSFASSQAGGRQNPSFQLPREETFQSLDTTQTGASEYDYANAAANLHAAFVGLAPPTPNNKEIAQKTSGETTLRGMFRTSSTVTSFDRLINAAEDLSSTLDDATSPRPPPANVPYTPSNYNTQPNLRRLAGGHNPRTTSSTYSLNKEVRLREAAKQQEALLRQERHCDDLRRIPYHEVPPHLRPSPVALKVAAQLIRDSPAGKLPIGPQAVLHSKSFWTGLFMAEVGIISTTAVISAIVHDRNAFTNEAGMGAASIFWLVISIILLIVGIIISVVAYIRKMGYYGNTERLLGLDEVGLVDRLLRRERPPHAREPELGSLPGSVQSFASQNTTPRQRQSLYATQSSVGRFTQASVNTLNPEWQELYMTPEQLREHLSQNNLHTPSKPGSKDPDSILSFAAALNEANVASPQPHTPAVAHTKSPINPFCHFPEPPTPRVPPRGKFYQLSGLSGDSVHDNERGRVEVDMWSPLENLQRDINSERVRNMPIQQRHSYITERRMASEERSRKIRESLEQSSITRSRNGTLSRRNSEGTTTRPPTICEENRGRSGYPSADDLVPEAQHGSFYDEDGVEMTDMGASTGKDTLQAEAKSEFHRRRASGGSVEKMKKMIASVNDHFTELNGRNMGSVVKEKIVRLREESKRGEGRK